MGFTVAAVGRAVDTAIGGGDGDGDDDDDDEDAGCDAVVAEVPAGKGPDDDGDVLEVTGVGGSGRGAGSEALAALVAWGCERGCEEVADGAGAVDGDCVDGCLDGTGVMSVSTRTVYLGSPRWRALRYDRY